MNRRELNRIVEMHRHHERGGMPDVGHPHSKAGYRFKIGGVRHNLGRDLLTAQYRARALFEDWLFVQAKGGGLTGQPVAMPANWKEESFAKAASQMAFPAHVAEQFNAEQSGRRPFSPGYKLTAHREGNTATVEAPAANTSTDTLVLNTHTAADRWIKNLDRRESQGDVSDSYATRAATTIDMFKKVTEAYPLAATGKPELDEIRIAIQGKRKSNGEPRRKETIRTDLTNLKTMFGWLDECELWPSPPRKWSKSLRPVYRNDDHDAADAGRGKRHDTYTLDELCKIYKGSGKAMKCWILCVLNFAWGQKEISTARRKHFKTEKLEARKVARFRHKRTPGAEPVPGRWTAWPETWAAVIQRMEETPTDPIVNPKGLAFLTLRKHQELVIYKRTKTGKRRREDNIDEAFRTVCKNAGVRCRGFYLLRHTAINMIKKISGKDVSDLFSQHAPETIGERHYNNDEWGKVRRALRIMREKLEPMFVR